MRRHRHQDNGYVAIEPEHYLTCWLALNDATLENGCIWARPRSHLGSVVEHKPTPIGLQCYFGDDPGIPDSGAPGQHDRFLVQAHASQRPQPECRYAQGLCDLVI